MHELSIPPAMRMSSLMAGPFMHVAPIGLPVLPLPPEVPGPELPPIAPKHPALPNPVPGLTALFALATMADPTNAFPRGAQPASIRNAHYTNTRAQLAYALKGPYNSFEGDVRMRGGIPVMQHDVGVAADLTFEQWATIIHRSGRHMRIDIKDAAMLELVCRILERLGVPSGRVTFNMSVLAPWSSSNQPIEAIDLLRKRFPRSWITLNLPMPFGPGYQLVAHAARRIGSERLGVAVMGGFVKEHDVRALRRDFAVVNCWNHPVIDQPGDIERETARLRAMGVNGMIDLRRREDPLAED